MTVPVDGEPHPSARSVFKSVFEGTGVYSILNIAQRLVSLLLLPISTRYLTTADYGVLGLIQQTFVVVTLLLGMQLSSAFAYFYFEKGSTKTPAQVVGTAFGGSLGLGLLGGAIGVAIAGPLGRLVFNQHGFELPLRIALAALPLYFLSEAVLAWLRIEERLKMYAVAALLSIPLNFMGVIALVAWMRWGVIGMVISNFSATAVITAVVVTYAALSIPLKFDFPLLKRMLRYSAPVGVSGIAMFVIHYGDSFVLPHYRALSEVGIYGTAYKIGMMESLVQISFLTYWNAQVFKIVQRDDARNIFARVFTHMTLLLAFSAIGLVLFARPALIILTQPAFYSAAQIVPLLVLAYFLRSFAEFWRSLFLATNHPGLDAICITISLAVCVTGYFLLIPRWGMWGAGCATAISFTFMAALTGIWSHRLWAYHLEKARLVKILFAAVVPIGLHFLVPLGSVWVQVVRAAVLLTTFPALLLAFNFVTPAEWEVLGIGWGRVRGAIGFSR